jgi:hypothetical protein
VLFKQFAHTSWSALPMKLNAASAPLAAPARESSSEAGTIDMMSNPPETGPPLNPYEGVTLEFLQQFPGEVLAFGLKGEGLLAHAKTPDELIAEIIKKFGNKCDFAVLSGASGPGDEKPHD